VTALPDRTSLEPVQIARRTRLGARALSSLVVLLALIPTSATAGVKLQERRIVTCANHERSLRGIAPLDTSSALAKAARFHANNMARHGFFDHTDPWGRDPGDRVALFDSRSWLIGENIAAGYRSVTAACRGWMASEGHRENILDPSYEYIGGGFAKGGEYDRYYVQEFGILADSADESAGGQWAARR
jgi:uncharacterized protein YkwD